MTIKKTLLVSALLLGVSTPAIAQDSNYYISGAGGLSILHDSDVSSNLNSEIDYDNGFAGVAALGYKFDNDFRVEGEYGYRSNDVESTQQSSSATGEASAHSFMINVVYDYENDSRFTPYVGVGAGIARVDLDNVTNVNGVTVNNDSTEGAFQGILGVSYAINPRFDFFASYRYFTTTGAELNTSAGDIDVDYDDSTILIGLRYQFGGSDARPTRKAEPRPVVERRQPVAVPQEPVKRAEPEPTPVRSYLVFFNLNSSLLTNDAKDILRDVAEGMSRPGVTRIELTGHADTTGTDEYNMWLSQKRADSVKAFLTGLGFDGNSISTMAKGERNLLVPTADGVLEPQNRRVEIVYE